MNDNGCARIILKADRAIQFPNSFLHIDKPVAGTVLIIGKTFAIITDNKFKDLFGIYLYDHIFCLCMFNDIMQALFQQQENSSAGMTTHNLVFKIVWHLKMAIEVIFLAIIDRIGTQVIERVTK